MNYRKIPFIQGMGTYSPEYPNAGFLSGVTPVNIPSKVILRPDTTKAAGIPGFLSWLVQAHPEVYNYAFAVVPSNVRIAMNALKTGGSNLAGSNAQIAQQAILARSTTGSQAKGLGDDTTAPLMDVSFDAGSVPLQTVSIADTGESTGTPTLTSAGTAQLISSLAAAGQAVVTGIDQQTIFNTQLARAKAGLPPLNTAAYFSTAGNAAFSSMGPLLLVGGGLGIFWLLSRNKSA